MDERLEKALEFSNYRAAIENRRAAIRRRFESMLIVHQDNGTFVSDKETLAFVSMLIDEGHNDAILIDVNQRPIEISDLSMFREKLLNNYFSATNEYSSELKKLNKSRDIKKAMNW